MASVATHLESASSRNLGVARRTRVCHVSVGLTTGGLERLLVDFARFHDRESYELVFVALQGLGKPAEEIRAAGCEVHALPNPSRGRWQRLRDLARLFRDLTPDVVHTHNQLPHVYGTAAARWAGVPAVIHTRHGQRFGHRWKSRLLFNVMSRGVDRIVSVSDDAARLCRSEDRVPQTKLKRIWNGIDLDRFCFRGPSERPVGICVARLSAEKDFPTLLKAVAIAARDVPEFRLQLVGNGAQRPLLERLIATLGLHEQVELLGERGDIPDLLANAGFFISSSLTEGLSLTLLEAMAVGLPILATSVGGNPEIVVEGVTGRLVPAADPSALAAGIVQMCRDSSAWPDMGRCARGRVEEHFDIRHMLRHYEDLYQETLARHQR